ncbi:MAG: DUF4329 domain-containing protein [Bacteroidia bacterium]
MFQIILRYTFGGTFLYFATLADISAVTSYQTNNTGLYKPSGSTLPGNGISFYFNEIKTYFGQGLVDQLLEALMTNTNQNLYIDKLMVNEWHIYGSSRLGIYKADVLVASKTVHITNGTGNTGTAAESEYNSTELSPLITPVLDLNYYSQTRGAKNYELSNHLGNVLVVITDKKTLCTNKEVYSTDFKTGTNGFDGGWSKYTQGGPNWSGIDQYNGSIVTNDNGRLKTTATVGYGGNRNVVNTDANKSYTFTFDLDIGNTTGLYVNARATNGSGPYTGTNLAQIYVTASGTYTLTFTAASATTQLLFEKDNYGTSYFYIDNARVEETISTAPGYYMADVVTANDYSPFGAPMATRSYTAPNSSYRFSFNGKERDNETYGEGNAYDFGARISDPRLGGRFFSVDPLTKKYPYWTPYLFAGNNPIRFIDVNGEGPGDLFKSMDGAANDFGLNYNDNSIVKNREYGAYIYKVKKSGEVFYTYNVPTIGTNEHVYIRKRGVPLFRKIQAFVHSHAASIPNDKNMGSDFSGGDIEIANRKNIIAYVTTPDGSLKKQLPRSDEREKTINTNQPSDPNLPKQYRKNDIDPVNLPKNEPEQKLKPDPPTT